MKTINLKKITSLTKDNEFKIIQDNSKNSAIVSWAFDEFIVTINKWYKNRLTQKTFSRKTKIGIINLIKKELKNLIGY